MKLMVTLIKKIAIWIHFLPTIATTPYFITSIDPSDVKLADLQKLVRDHWLIENSLHFVKDRWWDEDRALSQPCRPRRGLCGAHEFCYQHTATSPATRRLTHRNRRKSSLFPKKFSNLPVLSDVKICRSPGDYVALHRCWPPYNKLVRKH